MIKVIVLDFDGVIVESVDIKTEAFRDLFGDYPQHIDDIMNYHLSHNAISRYIKFEHIVTHILGETYNEERAREIGARFSELVRQKVIECPYVKGVEEFLQYFSGRVPLYIASASPQEELEVIVKARAIDRFFKGVYGTPWEKHDVIQEVMAAEKVRLDEVAYVGDSEEDLALAQKTGVVFVGRVNKEPFGDAMIPSYPNLVGVKGHLQIMMEGS